MRETVLLINFQDKKRLREIQMMLMTAKLRQRLVKKEEYLQTIGALAGVNGMELTEEIYTGEELGEEMMVFASLTENHLNQILYLMRKSNGGPVAYKAVMTETNREWKVRDLYAELAKEHEAMQKLKKKEGTDDHEN
ncbi:DUF3783 domain-containing protein [Roseburia hominis]